MNIMNRFYNYNDNIKSRILFFGWFPILVMDQYGFIVRSNNILGNLAHWP